MKKISTFKKIGCLLSISIFCLISCGDNLGSTRAGNPSIIIGQLEEETVKITMPLEVFNGSVEMLEGARIEVFQNGSLKHGNIQPINSYSVSEEIVSFTLHQMDVGDELRFDIYFSDGSVDEYTGLVSSFTDTQATLPESLANESSQTTDALFGWWVSERNFFDEDADTQVMLGFTDFDIYYFAISQNGDPVCIAVQGSYFIQNNQIEFV